MQRRQRRPEQCWRQTNCGRAERMSAFSRRLTAWTRRFFLELAGLRKHVSKGRVGVVSGVLNKSTLLTQEVCRNLPHVTLCLLGKFKGETGIDRT